MKYAPPSGTIKGLYMGKISNIDLRLANKHKNDEFYTQYEDIQKEMMHYKDYFAGKVVFCNCDDPFESNFFKYFVFNFNSLKLKKLIATCHVSSNISQNVSAKGSAHGLNKGKYPYKIEIYEVNDAEGMQDSTLCLVESLIQNKVNTLSILSSDGDFRSEECVQILQEADVVVTNPPFSLFREYVQQLIQYDKKFIILGNQNAITYKEIFKLIKKNLLWLGASIHSGDREFSIPHDYPITAASSRIDEQGKKYIRIKGVRWFTNVDYLARHTSLALNELYTPEKYPYYDNYNAINIDKTKEIPADFMGFMGVPITFMDKYSPEQFVILGIMNTGEENKGIRLENTPHGRPLIQGKEKYLRIIIKRK